MLAQYLNFDKKVCTMKLLQISLIIFILGGLFLFYVPRWLSARNDELVILAVLLIIIAPVGFICTIRYIINLIKEKN